MALVQEVQETLEAQVVMVMMTKLWWWRLTIEWEQPGIMPGDLSCRSFKFQQVGTSNSQSAIVTGLPSPTFSVDGGGNSSRSFPLGNIIVDALLTLANSTAISAGTAAAAAPANDAVMILGTIYGLGING